MPEKSREQTLVDLCFSMVLATTDDPVFCKRPRGERMAWVANTLREMGFDTHPVGMGWGLLVDRDLRAKFGPPLTENLDLWSAPPIIKPVEERCRCVNSVDQVFCDLYACNRCDGSTIKP